MNLWEKIRNQLFSPKKPEPGLPAWSRTRPLTYARDKRGREIRFWGPNRDERRSLLGHTPIERRPDFFKKTRGAARTRRIWTERLASA